MKIRRLSIEIVRAYTQPHTHTHTWWAINEPGCESNEQSDVVMSAPGG